MNKQKLKRTLEKYLRGECTVEEKDLIEQWYLDASQKEEQGFVDPNYTTHYHNIWSKLEKEIDEDKTSARRKIYSYIPKAIAASILLSLFTFSYFHFFKSESESAQLSEVIPGDNRASLFLADGTVILLDQVDENWHANDQGVKIKMLKDGLVVYEISDQSHSSNSNAYHTIKTPKGGQFQLILPDSSKVWLNANSAIKYPVNFNVQSREIELEGEAYFEVHSQLDKETSQKRPFIVYSNGQKVEVLGTRFNINAYKDENQIKTTILEGSVKVSPIVDRVSSSEHAKSRILNKRGQQAVVQEGKVSLELVNIDNIVDWKSGYFVFNNEDLYSILRKVGRWYDVEINYQGNIPNVFLDGVISKYENIESVLSVIEFAGGVKLSVKGRRLIVMP